jgi:beta-glucosidase
MVRQAFLLLALSVVISGHAAEPIQAAVPADWQAIPNPVPANPQVEQRIEQILSEMSLEQKIGQMIQPEIRSVTPTEVRKYALGSVLNGGGSFPQGNKHAAVGDWALLAKAYFEASSPVGTSKTLIPVLWGTDAVHGHSNVYGATLFPHNIALGASHNAELVEAIGAATAQEVAATGIDWVFAPTVAVASDFRWGRTYESFSEDPTLVQKLGASLVRGLQGQAAHTEFLGPSHVLSTAKHFIGDGGTSNGMDQGDTRISEQELAAVHGAGYRGALGAGAQTVMVSFSSWQGLKLHGHRYLLTDVLKGKLGFDGFVVSDWNGIGQVSGCSNASCVPAVLAGIDMFMVPEEWKAFYTNLLASVTRGEVPIDRINDAVRRILRVKARMGLLDQAVAMQRHSNTVASTVVGQSSHRELARRAVRESLVLLKNKGGILPLKRNMHVLVAGPAADDIGRQSGGWTLTWQGTGNNNADFPGATSIYAGIAESVKGYGSVELSPSGKHSKRPDVAIVVIGEEPYAEGQGDRSDLNLSSARPAELELLKRLKAEGIPVVTVLLTGRPLWTNPELNSSDAFMVAWLPGSEGAGIADVLFRAPDGSISHEVLGRLPFRWPAEPNHTQVVRNSTAPAPLFNLGYGLSYKSKDMLSDNLPVPFASASNTLADMKLFERGPVSPWRLSVGDKAGWVLPVTGSKTRSANWVITLTSFDRAVQEDSRRAEWNGTGIGQVFLHTTPAIDLSKMRAAGSALVVDMRLEARPTNPVELRMDCGYPCGAKGDISAILKQVPLNTWFSLSMDLACFENAGADLKRIDTGMLIATGGKLSLSFTGVRIVPGAAAKSVIRCAK